MGVLFVLMVLYLDGGLISLFKKESYQKWFKKKINNSEEARP